MWYIRRNHNYVTLSLPAMMCAVYEKKNATVARYFIICLINLIILFHWQVVNHTRVNLK